MKIDLNGQTGVITGGSRGIGAATVAAFAEAGARIVFSYRKAATLAQEVVKRAEAFPGPVIPVRVELSKMADAKKIIDTAVRRFGRLDILVANAGIWNATPVPI